jgi:hypothetical protein
LGQLPREVTQGLGYGALVASLVGGPSRVVVILVEDSLDEVLSVGPLVRGVFVSELVDEGIHELSHQLDVLVVNHSVVEVVHDEGANDLGFDIFLHGLQ